MKLQIAITAAALGLTLSACGAASNSGARVIHSNAPTMGSTGANALVCKHFLLQRNTVKNNANPTLADVEKLMVQVAVDAAQSTGKLHIDLRSLSDAMGRAEDVYQPSKRVYEDCTK